jgi:hypothetical protein
VPTSGIAQHGPLSIHDRWDGRRGLKQDASVHDCGTLAVNGLYCDGVALDFDVLTGADYVEGFLSPDPCFVVHFQGGEISRIVVGNENVTDTRRAIRIGQSSHGGERTCLLRQLDRSSSDAVGGAVEITQLRLAIDGPYADPVPVLADGHG